jgi:hypothetical protein
MKSRHFIAEKRTERHQRDAPITPDVKKSGILIFLFIVYRATMELITVRTFELC